MVQPLNACSAMTALFERVIFSNLQFWNANFPMLVSRDRSPKLVLEEQPIKAFTPTVVRESGNTKLVNLHLTKALSPTEVTAPFHSMEVKPLPLNIPPAISVILLSSVSFPSMLDIPAKA